MGTNEWTVASLLKLSGGFWEIAPLHAAVRLDLFTLIQREGSVTVDDLCRSLDASPRGVRPLVDALTAMGLLAAEGERYRLTPFSARHLSRYGDAYLGHIIAHHQNLVEGWNRLFEAVVTGRPVRVNSSHGDDPRERGDFLMGMFDLAMLNAPLVVPHIDLSGRSRLLDLGGGPGTWAIQFCLRFPSLSAVVYDLPTTRPFAEETIGRFGLGDRIVFHAGDFLVDPLPDGFDAVWISQVLHSEGKEECASLLAKVHDILHPGGIVLVQEFMLDDDRRSPLFPALFSLNMLVGTNRGRSYAVGELLALLESAGFSSLRRLDLELPNGIGIIAGIRT